jgi:hypothetical protein
MRSRRGQLWGAAILALALLSTPGASQAADYTVRLGDGPFISAGGMWVAQERGWA